MRRTGKLVPRGTAFPLGMWSRGAGRMPLCSAGRTAAGGKPSTRKPGYGRREWRSCLVSRALDMPRRCRAGSARGARRAARRRAPGGRGRRGRGRAPRVLRAGSGSGSSGTRALLASGRRFDAAIDTEPTELAVAVAYKGFVGFEMRPRGVPRTPRAPTRPGRHPGDGPVLLELAALDSRLQQGSKVETVASLGLADSRHQRIG